MIAHGVRGALEAVCEGADVEGVARCELCGGVYAGPGSLHPQNVKHMALHGCSTQLEHVHLNNRPSSTWQCLPADVARFQQLAEESRQLKQAKKHARKERRHRQQAKPLDEAAVRLAEHRAKVAKQERELHKAKADQQKAEAAANKRRLLLQRDRHLRDSQAPVSCDPDEGESQHTQLPLNRGACEGEATVQVQLGSQPAPDIMATMRAPRLKMLLQLGCCIDCFNSCWALDVTSMKATLQHHYQCYGLHSKKQQQRCPMQPYCCQELHTWQRFDADTAAL